MKKVLIVDDEYRIGLLIKSLIRWDELELENIAVVDKSEVALKMILERKPDIVITDIRMPKIDGLEMIRRVRESGLRTSFIVISGYREFEYARRAMSYGVDEYLLKPINDAELHKALVNVCEKIEKENYTLDVFNNFKESKQILRSDMLNRIIEDENIEMKNPILDLNAEYYCGVLIKLDYRDYSEKSEKQDVIVIKKIRQMIEEILCSKAEEYLIAEKDCLQIYCLINYSAETQKKITVLNEKLLSEVKTYLLGFERYTVTIGIGNEKTQFQDMKNSIDEAYHAVCNRMCYGTGRLIHFENLDFNEKDYFSNAVEHENTAIKNAIETLSVERIDQIIETVFEIKNPLHEYDFTDFYEAAQRVTEVFFRLCPDNSEPFIQEQKTQLLEKLFHCNMIRQTVNTLKTVFDEVINLIISRKNNESVLPIRLAREYVEKHYREKIQLETIAAHISLNPAYFSSLFKKETGMTFSAYLAEVRMEKAKALLVSTNDTIEAIGFNVGYGDYKYFCQQFKKIVGVKPNVYRKLYS